jgi:hypothetical protein
MMVDGMLQIVHYLPIIIGIQIVFLSPKFITHLDGLVWAFQMGLYIFQLLNGKGKFLFYPKIAFSAIVRDIGNLIPMQQAEIELNDVASVLPDGGIGKNTA